MTLGIGYHCFKGLIVAADSLIGYGGDKKEGKKVESFVSGGGAYATAFASDDSNAAITLVREIQAEILIEDIPYYSDLERLIKKSMAAWCQAYTQSGVDIPANSIILGVMLRGANGGRLYLCEPPNTVLRKDDYVAIGTGRDITDPLHEKLFAGHGSFAENVQGVLRRIAYLSYRAEKGKVSVGLNTDAAVIFDANKEPLCVSRIDFERAIRQCPYLDTVFGWAAYYLLSENISPESPNNMAELVKNPPEDLRMMFKDSYGEVINVGNIIEE